MLDVSFRNFFKESLLLSEGGNIFSDVRINRSEVVPTVKSLEKLTGMSLLDSMLGSTGKADTSGDIDLVVDENKVNKDSFIKDLVSKGIDPKDLKKTGIEVAYRAPIIDIQGNKTGNHIQVDFMFHGDPDYLKFYYASNEMPPYKGAHRNITMSALAKTKGLLLSMKGLFERETKAFVSKDPNVIAKRVLGEDATVDDLKNIPSLMNYLKSHYPPEKVKDMIKDAEETIKMELP
jgi:hypothetical protein